MQRLMATRVVIGAAILATAAYLTAGSARAQVLEGHFDAETVESMAKLCSAVEDDPSGAYAVGFCYGWLEGLGQFYEQVFLDPRFGLKPVVCGERELSREEVRAIFIDWADAHPEQGNREALSGLVAAMKEKFPCQ